MPQLQAQVLDRLRAGLVDCILVTPPCSTWSRVRAANLRGPPPLRDRNYVWGYPWLSNRWTRDLKLGNILIHFTIDVLTRPKGTTPSSSWSIRRTWARASGKGIGGSSDRLPSGSFPTCGS